MLLGVFATNIGSPALRGNSVPDTEVESATEYPDWDRDAVAESEPESEPESAREQAPEPEPESKHRSRRSRHAVSHR